MFEFEFFHVSKSSPLLVLSLLHLSPRANVYHILSTLMGTMFSRSTPCRLPQAQRFFLSSGLLTRFLHLHPLPVSLSPSPSRPVPSPLPSSHLPYPSPVSPHPLTVSPLPISLTLTLSPSSSLASITHYDPARSLAPRASLDLLPSPSRVASPLVLFARRVFVFLAPPSRHSAVAAPPPRLTSTPAQLCRQIR